MNILIAPNSMKGSLTAVQFAEAVASGLRQVNFPFQTKCIPVADGGDGTGEVLAHTLNAKKSFLATHDALMRATLAPVYFNPDDGTAIIEMADICGMKMLKPNELNVMKASTYGVGLLIRKLDQLGYHKVYVGIGGSATVDGGIGALQGLGVKFYDKHDQLINVYPENIHNISKIDTSRLKLKTEIEVLCDVDNRLLGNNGAARVFAPQKGASQQQVEELETVLTFWDNIVFDATQVRISKLVSSGAAGGIGGALHAFAGAKLIAGAQRILSLSNFDEAVQWADIVITGEGCIDSQTRQMKAPYVVADTCRRAGKKVIAIAGSVKDNCNFDAAYSIWNQSLSIDEAMANAYSLVKSKTKKLANDILNRVL